MLKLLILYLLIVSIVSCRKYKHCGHATTCIKNIGSTAIACAWNSNGLADTLRSGQTTCIKVGEFNANPRDYAADMIYFQTNNATRAIPPTSCNTEKEIEF